MQSDAHFHQFFWVCITRVLRTWRTSCSRAVYIVPDLLLCCHRDAHEWHFVPRDETFSAFREGGHRLYFGPTSWETTALCWTPQISGVTEGKQTGIQREMQEKYCEALTQHLEKRFPDLAGPSSSKMLTDTLADATDSEVRLSKLCDHFDGVDRDHCNPSRTKRACSSSYWQRTERNLPLQLYNSWLVIKVFSLFILFWLACAVIACEHC